MKHEQARLVVTCPDWQQRATADATLPGEVQAAEPTSPVI